VGKTANVKVLSLVYTGGFQLRFLKRKGEGYFFSFFFGSSETSFFCVTTVCHTRFKQIKKDLKKLLGGFRFGTGGNFKKRGR